MIVEILCNWSIVFRARVRLFLHLFVAVPTKQTGLDELILTLTENLPTKMYFYTFTKLDWLILVYRETWLYFCISNDNRISSFQCSRCMSWAITYSYSQTIEYTKTNAVHIECMLFILLWTEFLYYLQNNEPNRLSLSFRFKRNAQWSWMFWAMPNE